MAENEKRAPKTRKNNAETTEKTQTPAVNEKTPVVPAEEKNSKTYSAEEVDEIVAKAVAKAMANQAPQVVQIKAETEQVNFLYMAEVANDNIFYVGENGAYGRIIGKTGAFSVPKNELSRVMDGLFRLLLQRREIIVVSGLTDDEREIYGVNYREGELLDKMAFAKLVEIEGKILDIYPKLCPAHREMVAKRYFEAYLNRNHHVRRDVVKELNDMSIALGSEKGDFDAILEMMNEADRKK